LIFFLSLKKIQYVTEKKTPGHSRISHSCFTSNFEQLSESATAKWKGVANWRQNQHHEFRTHCTVRRFAAGAWS